MQALSELEKLSLKLWDVFSRLSLSDSVYDLILRKGGETYRSLNYSRSERAKSLAGVLKTVKNVLPRDTTLEFSVVATKDAVSELLGEVQCTPLWTVHFVDMTDLERYLTVHDCLDNYLIATDVKLSEGEVDSLRITLMPFSTPEERAEKLRWFTRYTLADVDTVLDVYTCEHDPREVMGL